MSDRRFTILSTAPLPMDRITAIPESIHISIIPFTEIIARGDETLKSEINALSAKKIIVVFTSAQAVKIVASMLNTKPKWKIYCIRNETRIAVVNWFGAESIINFAGNAWMLSQCMIHDAVKEVLFFCGDQRLDILPENLKKQGVRLTELIVYETRLTPVRLIEQPDAILFFSPTAVRSFFSMNELSGNTRVFAMGKTTTAALHEFTSEPIIISPESDKAFVVNMAVEYAVSHPIS